MITDHRVEIGAPSQLVWKVFSDVERWPEWTASVTSLVGLDGPGLAVGKRLALGALVGRLMINKTKRFLELEGNGLKACAEQRSRANGPNP